MELVTALAISARGMDAQPDRLRALAETLAARMAVPRGRSGTKARRRPGGAGPQATCATNLGTLVSVRNMLARTLDMLH